VDEFEAFGERATYGAGAVFARAPFRLHAAAGTGFRAPSLSERFETSAFNVGNPDLRPEQSQSWQLGADWSVDGLRLAATYFQTRIEDLIEYDFGELQNTNIGQAKIDGVELRADAAVSAWATLQMTYDWTDARDAAGDRLARRPEHSWSVSATIRPNEHSSVVLSWRTVGERTDVVYDDAGAFLTTAGVVDGSGVGALAATYDLDARTQAFVRIDNITDEIYEQPAAFAGEPRTAMVGIRARP
jgi:vitamin B12 transporter